RAVGGEEHRPLVALDRDRADRRGEARPPGRQSRPRPVAARSLRARGSARRAGARRGEAPRRRRRRHGRWAGDSVINAARPGDEAGRKVTDMNAYSTLRFLLLSSSLLALSACGVSILGGGGGDGTGGSGTGTTGTGNTGTGTT